MINQIHFSDFYDPENTKKNANFEKIYKFAAYFLENYKKSPYTYIASTEPAKQSSKRQLLIFFVYQSQKSRCPCLQR